MTYWHFGEEAAAWAFERSPHKGIFFAGGHRKPAADMPHAWRTYFDAGDCRVTEEGELFRVRVFDLPLRHIYFEYMPVGFVKKGLELTGAGALRWRCIAGISRGDDHVHYELARV
jgi:hypothetical protein